MTVSFPTATIPGVIWFSLCLATAVFVGTTDALIKTALKTQSPTAVALGRYVWSSLFLLPFVFAGSAPSDPRAFWTATIVALPIEVAAALMYQHALHRSPLSLTVPYLAFTPVFLLLTGWIMLGERPTVPGILGVALVTAGALALQRRPAPGRSWASWIIPSDRGSLLILCVALLYSFTSALTKRAVLAGSPLSFPGIYFGLLSVCLVPFQFRAPGWARSLVSRPALFAAVGILEAITLLLQFEAYLHVEVAYVISIKRLSPLVAVFYGRLFFHERASPARLVGAALMVGGAAVIALFS